LAIMIISPWSKHQQFTFNYIREKAIELAEVLEHKQIARFSIDWSSEDVYLTISIVKPNEEPIMITLNYTQLIVKIPIYTKEITVIRGSPYDKKFEEFRRVSVYHNGSWIIVDPKPIVKCRVVSEYGRKYHLIEVVIFRIEGRLEVG